MLYAQDKGESDFENTRLKYNLHIIDEYGKHP